MAGRAQPDPFPLINILQVAGTKSGFFRVAGVEPLKLLLESSGSDSHVTPGALDDVLYALNL